MLLVVRTDLKKGSDVTFFGFLRMNRDDNDAVVGWKDPIPNEYTWLCSDHFVSGC